MAKLSARGARVLAKVERTTENGRYQRVLRSDYKILRNHGTGWTISGTLKPDVTVDQWITAHIRQGWTEVAK